MKSPYRFVLRPLLFLTLCMVVVAPQGFAQDDNDDELTDQTVKSFVKEHLPELGKELKDALEDNDPEWIQDVLDYARDIIFDYRYWKDSAGPEIATVYLQVTNTEEELNNLSIEYEDVTDERERATVKEQIESILRKMMPEQLKLDKAKLAALKEEVKEFERDIKEREDNPEVAFKEQLEDYLPTSLVRTWTSDKGVKVEAEFVELIDDIAILKKLDGKEVRVSLDKLSEKDRAWIRQQVQE